MLASINPLGERARNTRWGRTVSWYTAGSVVGGATVGAGFGALGLVLHALVVPSATALGLVVLGASVAGLALDLRLAGTRLPTLRRQVDEDWLVRYRGWVYGGGFGFQLGAGLVTIVTTSTVYLMFVLAVLTGSVSGGLLIGATFGLARALPILAVARAEDPERLRRVLRHTHALAEPSRRVALGCLLIVGMLTLVTVLA